MITYVKGDLMDATQDIIAHGVNCQGRFGSGVAGAIKDRYPLVREAYLAWPEKTLGTCQFLHAYDRFWANAFTQEFYGYDGKQYADLMAVGLCCADIEAFMKENGLTSIAMPKIGCGLGGLKWENVELIVSAVLEDFDVFVYEL